MENIFAVSTFHSASICTPCHQKPKNQANVIIGNFPESSLLSWPVPEMEVNTANAISLAVGASPLGAVI